MRNLLPTRRAHVHACSTEAPDLPLTACAWDPASDSLICTFGPSKTEAVIEIKRLKKEGSFDNITSFDIPCEAPTTDCDQILDVHFFTDTNTICMVFAAGNIIFVEVDEGFISKGVEIVGSVDEGITTAAWSPDEEVLAISTAASTFLLMTRNFENIATKVYTEADLLASNHVSVGWGKKETQFQGKRAKAMRDPTVPEHVDEGVLSAGDDGKVRISWRGDGAYLAVSTVESEKRRLIRIYNREGNLDSVSEPVDGLEGTLSWRPCGNLISGIRRFPEGNRMDVVFFERNGLRHGEFTLSVPGSTFEGQKIYQLAWNADSTVLALVLKGRVQLWTMGNYHHYLKQEIIYDSGASLVYPEEAPVVLWHPEKALKLALSYKDKVVIHEWVWNVSRGGTDSPNDHGMVAVVDGGRLKLTPLRWTNIPPPMALYDIPLDSTPVDVAVCRSEGLVAVLRNTGLDVIKWYPGKPRNTKKPDTFINIVPFQTKQSVRQVTFCSPTLIAVLMDSNGACMLKYFNLDSNLVPTEAREDILPINTSIIIPEALGAFDDLYYVDDYHDVYSTRSSESEIVFPVSCSWVEIVKLRKKIIYFGLSDNGKLYANDTLVASNCTSFIITRAHLIYTTTHHLLKFVHLETDGNDLEIPADDPTEDERCRAIERGAKLIHVMPSTFSLVLQMPRGNLETIFPRALVVAGIRCSIMGKDYKTAFLACRSHRVDLNILHDHQPQQFLQNVPLFIEQVKKVEYIDLFLSQLREEDVSQTMYRETLRQTLTTTKPQFHTITSALNHSKVNSICQAFLDNLLPSMLSANLQNIVTAYVCKLPPDYDSALLLIAKLREEDVELAERAIEHVCFLADANKLYHNALGLYNLELTLMVAQQSQKDPREYLPFLQSLEELEPARRRFAIDDHLNRHSKAIISLVELGDDFYEEVKAYIVRHELYQQAFTLYKYQEEKLKELMHMYADWLDKHSRFREAGLAYESVQQLRPALQAYRRANLWQHALSLALLIPLSKPELSDLSQSLADHCIETKDFSSAAQIYLDYRHDIAEASRLLCRGSHFTEAIRLVCLHQNSDLLETVVDAGLIEVFGTTLELLADCKTQADAQISRLRELRTRKEEDPLAYFEGLPEGSGANIPDTISVAPTDASTTGGTFLTRYTGKTTGTALTGATRRTSKNRRREERKRARGKKGTIYEEEYLVRSLGRLVDRVESVKGEVGRLIEGMVRRGMRERAGVVQNGMKEMEVILKEVIQEVFSDTSALNLFLSEGRIAMEEGEGGLEGTGRAAGEVCGEMKIPVLSEFVGLTIL